MALKNPDRSIFEHIVVIAVVLVVAFLVSANIYYQRLDTKQKAMFYQLQIIRNGINLYKVVERENPKSLMALSEAIYSFPGDRETRKFLTNVPFGPNGEMIDPFGVPYIYDVNTGWIRSGTSGYEMW